MNKSVAYFLVLSLLVGCSNFEKISKDKNTIEEVVANNSDIVDRIRNTKSKWKNVNIRNSIFAPPVEYKEVKRPEWWYKKVSFKSSSMNLKDAIDQLLIGTGVNFSYRDGIALNKSIIFSGNTIGDAIESIAGASGYSYSIPYDNKLVFSIYETRTFTIAALPGTEKYLQGQNQTISEDSKVSSTAEYITAEGEVDVLEEAYRELVAHSSFRNTDKAKSSAVNDLMLPPVFPTEDELLDQKNAESKSTKDRKELDASDIPIFVSRATSSITVKDTPEVLDMMQKIIDEKNRKLLTQVELDIDIIEVKLSAAAAQNYDLAIALKDIGKYGFSFSSGSVVNAQNSMIGSASLNFPTGIISAGVNSGDFSGSKAVAEALRSVGSVSSRTMPRQIIKNNTIAKMRDFQNLSYIIESSTSNTANVGSQTTMKQGNLELGFSLYAMPSVYMNNITIRLATNISSLISLVKKGNTDTSIDEDVSSTTSYVESPLTTHKDFMSTFAAYNGDTIILSGLSRDNKASTDAKGMTSSAQNHNSERTETLVLITPRIIHPRI
ncbi:hypothetical protein QXB71_002630 [Vibrio cholerae]|nr:hypothetical protein [Vibrio cholerae]